MKKIVLVFVLTMLSAQVANAANGYYAGVSAGQSKVSDFCDGVPGGVSCNDSDTGWKVFGGYQATENFGIEVSWVDFGEAILDVTPAGFPLTVTGEASGFGVVGTGMLPVSERFGLFGKVGVFRWDLEVRADVFGQSAAVEDDGIGLTYGFGAKVKVTENVGIRVEWEQFPDVGNNDTTGEDDLSLLSAGVVLSF